MNTARAAARPRSDLTPRAGHGAESRRHRLFGARRIASAASNRVRGQEECNAGRCDGNAREQPRAGLGPHNAMARGNTLLTTPRVACGSASSPSRGPAGSADGLVLGARRLSAPACGGATSGPTACRSEGATPRRTNVLLWPGPGRADRVDTAATPTPPLTARKTVMKNRLAKTLLATAAIAAFAAPIGAQASQGADDPAGHLRQESRQAAGPPRPPPRRPPTTTRPAAAAPRPGTVTATAAAAPCAAPRTPPASVTPAAPTTPPTTAKTRRALGGFDGPVAIGRRSDRPLFIRALRTAGRLQAPARARADREASPRSASNAGWMGPRANLAARFSRRGPQSGLVGRRRIVRARDLG